MGWLRLDLKIERREKRKKKRQAGKPMNRVDEWMMIVINRAKVTDCMVLQRIFGKELLSPGQNCGQQFVIIGLGPLASQVPVCQLRQRKFLSDC